MNRYMIVGAMKDFWFIVVKLFIINRESESYRPNLRMSRCDERLKARVEETCLTYTGLHDKTN